MAYGGIESDYRPARWGSFREPYKFSGKEEDIEVGLSYFGARYYSTALGRWMSPDAVTIHDLKGDANPYAYVHGSPLMGVDPDGNFAQMFWGAVIGAVVSTVTQFAVNGSVDWGQVGQAAVVGAITGGVGSVLGVATSLLANAAIGAATGAAGYLAQSGVSYVASGGKSSGFSWTGLAVSTGVGAVSGGVSSQLPAAIQGNAAAKIASGSVMSMGGYAAATAASGDRITTKGLSTSAASGGVSAMASLGAGKLQAQESEGPDHAAAPDGPGVAGLNVQGPKLGGAPTVTTRMLPDGRGVLTEPAAIGETGPSFALEPNYRLRGGVVSRVGTPRITVKVRTTWAPGANPDVPSGYGRGTTADDIAHTAQGHNTVRFHESMHRADMKAYVAHNAMPDLELAVGMSRAEAQTAVENWGVAVEEYGKKMSYDSYLKTDCVGSPKGGCP